MAPDFPRNIRIRLAPIDFFFVAETEQRQEAKKNLIGPKLFLYYEENLVSNLNSKLFRFHCVRPNVHSM